MTRQEANACDENCYCINKSIDLFQCYFSPSLAKQDMKTHDAMTNGIATLGKFGLTIDSLTGDFGTMAGISGLTVDELAIIS